MGQSVIIRKRGRFPSRPVVCGIFTLVITCLSARANPAGSISGKVVDPTDAVIPAATVTIVNPQTGVRQTTTTNAEGYYSLPALPPAQYQIEADRSGFRRTVQTGIFLETGKALEIDLKLELGEQSTAVTVTESGLQVDTADTTTGEAMASAKMAAVPLNGRSFTDLLALQPGVVPASSQQPNAVVMSGCTKSSPSGDLNPGNLSVAGQRETNNGFVVNGSTVQEDFSMGTALVPNLDSIQEFRVLTSNFEAEYGNYSGGQVVVTTKSGTNGFHGSAFDFLRNTSLDARNFFSSDRAGYEQNQFGGTFGGPIQKQRSFFFARLSGNANDRRCRDRLDLRTDAGGAGGRSFRRREFVDRHGQRTIVGRFASAAPGLPRIRRGALLHCRMRELSAVRFARRAGSSRGLVGAGAQPAAIHSRAQPGRKHIFLFCLQPEATR